MHTDNDPTLPDFSPSSPLSTALKKVTANIADTVIILSSDLRVTWSSRPGDGVGDVALRTEQPGELLQRIHPDDREYADRIQRQLLSESGAFAKGTVRVADSRGSYQSILFTAANHFSDPDINGLLVTLSPATRSSDRHRLDGSVRDAGGSGRSDLLDHLINEVRSCSSSLRQSTESLTMLPLSEAAREQVELLTETTATLEKLLADANDLSLISDGSIELDAIVFNPSQIISDVAADFASTCTARGLDLRLRLDAALSNDVRGDAGRLRRVLVQLVDVVVQTASEGTVHLEGSVDEDTRVRFRIHHAGRRTEQKMGSPLLDPLTTMRQQPSIGLGLAVARQLVELMDGSLGYETSDRGTAFWFDISCRPARRLQDRRLRQHHLDRHEQPAPAMAAPEEAAVPSGRLHVLVVDDSDVNRLLAASQLERLGHTCETAKNGHDALTWMTSERFDAVLMDWHMPGMDGLEATTRWRSQHDPDARLPIISMTASAMSGDRERCLDAGANDYLSKPVSITDLDAMLVRWTTASGSASKSTPLASSTEQSKVDQLIEDLGDVKVVHSIIEAFIDMVPQYRSAAAAALAVGDRASIRRHAHTLKSTAVMLGTDELAQACRELEAAAAVDSGDLEGPVLEFSRCCRDAELALIDLSAQLMADDGHPL